MAIGVRRLLVLSFYYPPDLCAGSFRVGALVDALRVRYPSIDIEVITTLPNRYSTFDSKALQYEANDRLIVKRIKLPSHKSGMRDQARSFVTFAKEAMRLVNAQKYDLVFATSSRLMTATLGARIAAKIGAPLYLDIRDIFVDTMNDVLPTQLAFLIRPMLSMIERWTINRGVHINLVSQGFESYFKARYSQQSFSYFTNGIDSDFLVGLPIREQSPNRMDGRVKVLYAGNIGEGQGLHAIIPKLALLLNGRVSFKIIGDGGRRQQLEDAIRVARVENVKIHPPVSRTVLIKEYLAADVLFLHLNDYEAFKKVLPSKIFEYAALGKPIWAGVGGYAAQFLRREVSNCAVFAPCVAENAVSVFGNLLIEDSQRTGFVEKYTREKIMYRMAEDIVSKGDKAPR